jgi:UDP-N-acetylmuramate: L-alanyl-gamma-D-glutamyl-meso-diaminopimelate ligase
MGMKKHLHILGICGTFMGGLAMIARELGYQVSGSDQQVYPPMSNTLAEAGITISEGYKPEHLQPAPDLVIIGNTVKRGNPAIEYVLNEKIPYISGPQWLAENVLHHRHVIAITGTHGKTTTTSLLTWILTQAGLNPGYLIGGVASDFASTAALGKDPFFVIEGDEYDCAFFDKRSKFLHYRPETLVINNIEFDHADIFEDLEAIFKQFQFLLRIVPSKGAVIYNGEDPNIQQVLSRECYPQKITFGPAGEWQAKNANEDGSRFDVFHRENKSGTLEWKLVGQHNVANGLAAIAAAHAIGISPAESIKALSTFSGIKRRLEVRGVVNGITVYDDFAHHPTAIQTTLNGLRAKVKNERIFAILQFASNTMRMGHHQESIANALAGADQIIFLKPDQWDISELTLHLKGKAKVLDTVDDIIENLNKELKSPDHVLIMSNKGFEGIHERLLARLAR